MEITADARGSPSRTASIAAMPTADPSAITGASGPSTAPKPSVPIAASATPGAWRHGRRRHAQPLARRVAAVARQEAAGDHDDQRAGHGQPDHEEPRRRRVAEAVRQVVPEPVLELVDEGEEQRRDERRRYADRRRQRDEAEVDGRGPWSGDMSSAGLTRRPYRLAERSSTRRRRVGGAVDLLRREAGEALVAAAISSSSSRGMTSCTSSKPSGARSSASCMTCSGPVAAVGEHDRASAARDARPRRRRARRGSAPAWRARVASASRVEDRLRGAVRADRIHRVRGVAEQRDAADAPARQRIAVDQRVLEDRAGAVDQRGHVEPVEAPVRERGAEVGDGRPGAFQSSRRRRVARRRGSSAIQLIVCSAVGSGRRDRVADELLVLVAGHDHRARRRGTARPRVVARHSMRPPYRTAPSSRVDAARGRVEWMPSAPISRSPRRWSTRRCRASRTCERRRSTPSPASLERRRPPGRRRRRRRRARSRDGVEQQQLQRAAVERELRPVVAGGAAARLAPDALAVAVEVDELGGLDGPARRVARARPRSASTRTACGSRLMPTPSGRISRAASKTRQREARARAAPARRSARRCRRRRRVPWAARVARSPLGVQDDDGLRLGEEVARPAPAFAADAARADAAEGRAQVALVEAVDEHMPGAIAAATRCARSRSRVQTMPASP